MVVFYHDEALVAVKNYYDKRFIWCFFIMIEMKAGWVVFAPTPSLSRKRGGFCYFSMLRYCVGSTFLMLGW